MSKWSPDSYQPLRGADAPEGPVADALPGATWWRTLDRGDGTDLPVDASAWTEDGWLTFEGFCEGDRVLQLKLLLSEERTEGVGGSGMANAPLDEAPPPGFMLTFSLYPQAKGRVRLPMSALRLGRWLWPREGAVLKPMTSGRAVLPDAVRHARLLVNGKADGPVRFGLTPLVCSPTEPARLDEPFCSAGRLLDEVGQSTLRDWEGKATSSEEVVEHLRSVENAGQEADAGAGASRYGGFPGPAEFEPTGRFRTHHDGRRWFLVDPDGHRFWSAGVDCFRVDGYAPTRGLGGLCDWLPDRDGPFGDCWRDHSGEPEFSWFAANHRRAFGDGWRERWASGALTKLRRSGFNTVANWSEWWFAAKAGFPYVRPMNDLGSTGHPMCFRDFPDVHHPGFEEAAARWAGQLNNTADDPALIGYFLTNEPQWAFASQVPAEGMLRTTENGHSRDALARWLGERYPDGRGLAEAWGRPDATLRRVASGRWDGELGPGAVADLTAFSEEMVRSLWTTLCRATKAADPGHLNLGVRFAFIPPEWARPGLEELDVFSFNSYADVPPAEVAKLSEDLGVPGVIGEFHYGGLDAGMPAAALVTVATQRDRGLAYRRFVEHAAAAPWCVGTHWFTLNDQATLGRFDGEPYNCGLIDVTGRPYTPLVEAAAKTHRRLPGLCSGELSPVEVDPDVRPRLSV